MHNDGLIHACRLDGKGGARWLDWTQLDAPQAQDGALWVHLDYSTPQATQWLQQHSGLDEVTVHALLREETRPRASSMGNGTLIILRGMNLNPGSDPEDMVSIRLWVERGRIVSTGKRSLRSINDIVDILRAGQGPRNTGALLASFAARLTGRMEDIIGDLEDRASQMEEAAFDDSASGDLRSEWADIRRQTIALRRYLSPQRDAVSRLYSDEHDWLANRDRLKLRESADQLQRYVENLDSIRERAMVSQEERANRLSEQINARIYLMSLVAALFLPLSFFTGLLGINVGGIPGADNKTGFVIVVAILLAVVVLQLMYLKLRKWF